MDDPTVYAQKLSAFGRMLRLEGLSVSPKETEDASRILIQLGFSDRSTVKTALRTVYAKTQEQQLLFDKVFDGFFISEEAMRKQAKEQMERQAQAQRNREQAQEELEAYYKNLNLLINQKSTVRCYILTIYDCSPVSYTFKLCLDLIAFFNLI